MISTSQLARALRAAKDLPSSEFQKRFPKLWSFLLLVHQYDYPTTAALNIAIYLENLEEDPEAKEEVRLLAS